VIRAFGECKRALRVDKQAAVEEWSKGKLEELPPPPPPTGPALDLLNEIWKK